MSINLSTWFKTESLINSGCIISYPPTTPQTFMLNPCNPPTLEDLKRKSQKNPLLMENAAVCKFARQESMERLVRHAAALLLASWQPHTRTASCGFTWFDVLHESPARNTSPSCNTLKLGDFSARLVQAKGNKRDSACRNICERQWAKCFGGKKSLSHLH